MKTTKTTIEKIVIAIITFIMVSSLLIIVYLSNYAKEYIKCNDYEALKNVETKFTFSDGQCYYKDTETNKFKLIKE